MTTNTTKTIRAARYLRVSRTDQVLDLQDDETAELVERRGWQLTATFSDQGVSGTKDKRPGLDLLLAQARKRAFDVLVVYRSDRLFRSLKHMVVTLDELTSLGIGFVSATEVFDSTTPQGKLLLHLVSAFGEFERGVLIERVRSGLAAARRRGAKLGRPKLTLDREKALQLRGEGLSFREIAEQLGVGLGTVQRAVKVAVPNTPAFSTEAEAQVPATC